MILRLCLLAFAARSAQATFQLTDAPFDRCATSHGLSLDDSLYIFVLSEDSTLWQKRQERGGWSSWQLIGAGNRFASKPAVLRSGDGRLRVFVRGIDHAVYSSSQLEPNGELWDGWTCFGGQFAAGPVATVNAQGFIDIFAVGRDTALYTMSQTLNGTEARLSLVPPPPPPPSAPLAVADPQRPLRNNQEVCRCRSRCLPPTPPHPPAPPDPTPLSRPA